ncbi:uncharacterized protein SPSK_00979 [Sporothrix schenckii 1099-18]|uniref:PH domain-containing protein n=1 Tax=Sporothrix schenckii 1099-18 TaxID=1397361 RepID=A0A0F2LWT9_SPOSC|nr:uncharacterized protein SPSK_00979 [Sporothrix schenckii 1099-18]KJR81309.1 hypothetical protein SPSK_00979 [Sporothrix schenckii 1099-18]
MSEAGDSTHKRTKSAALSILRRKDRNTAAGTASGAGTGDEDATSEDGSVSAPLSHSNSGRDLPAMAYQQQSQSSSSTPVPFKGHVSRASGAGGSLTGRSPSSTHVASSRPGVANASSSNAPPAINPASGSSPSSTLEQSVRKFRIVEALRSGDTAYITKAIRETSDTTGARASISSFATASAAGAAAGGGLDDTTVLHLAIQCAEFAVVEYVLSDGAGLIDTNARDKDGNTALHLAAAQGRTQVVRLLLEQKDINDSLPNGQGRLPLDLARNPEIFQLLQLSRSLFTESKINEIQDLIARGEYHTLAQVLEEPRLKTVLDINSTEFVSDPVTSQAGGTLLHEAARRKNSQLIQVLLLHGADPFRRDRKGKLPQDVTKDDVTRAMLKKSPAAVAAQRGIQEKAVLGAAAQGGLGYGSNLGGGGASSSALGGGTAGGAGGSASGAGGTTGSGAGGPPDPLAGREAREMKGYLKKWTNYRKGYQLRWFVLEDGVLSYYKHQDDAGSACRGAINMRIARLNMSADEKTKFEIIGKSSVKYTLKANHEVEAKRWFWALNNSIQWTKDQAKEEERQRARSAELLRQAKADHSLQPQASHQSHLSLSQTTSINNDAESANASPSPAAAAAGIHGDSGRRNSAQLSRIQSAAQRSVSHKAMVTAGGVGASTAGSIDDDTGTGLGVNDYADAVEGKAGGANYDNGGDDDDPGDDDLDASSGHDRDAPSATRDALNITAQSARLQLETMAQVNQALVAEVSRNPALTLADTKTTAALSTYDAAIRSLTGLIGDLMRISRDRDAFWQYRLDREVEMRRMWEESMAQVAREQEALEARVGEAEEKKKSARRILKEVINNGMLDEQPASSAAASPHLGNSGVLADSTASAAVAAAGAVVVDTTTATTAVAGADSHHDLIIPSSTGAKSPSIYTANTSRRQTVLEQVAAAGLSDSDDDDDDEFFDAVDAGEVVVESRLPSETATATLSSTQAKTAVVDETAEVAASLTAENEAATVGDSSGGKIVVSSGVDISKSFKGYENGIRHRLKIDADNRPKLSLWSILKSMVGKDMTKMTLPVTFNEPTSLLYRCGEDMEYADLLDRAVERSDSIERLIYVAAFAASEYASTIGRVAKPFNPLLGETFEYVRPDKNYRFFIEQVSHHPPVGAAWAESPHWTYYGESAVKSKFYGKSFDINPLGTWFLKLRPKHGGKEDFFTWKKVTSSVIGIITGSPTVDNYGVMEIKNWTTGEIAYVDFKPRGWTAASAYVISGKIVDATGRVRVSLGGRWNSKMYARMTPGYQASVTELTGKSSPNGNGTSDIDAATGQISGPMADPNRVYLIWQANERPKGIPFNLTPFVLTFNDINDQLRPWIAPTDSRLRPDQRAMEEGNYDFAATEKNRLENEQRSRRRDRETLGEEFVPAWFEKAKCPITGEAYWQFNGKYWDMRDRAGQGDRSVWDHLEPIFVEQNQ